MDFYMKEKNINKAIELMEEAISINDQKYYYYYNLGILFTEIKDKDSAIKAFEACLEISPDFESARYNLANQLIAKANFEKAAENFELIIEKNPVAIDALYNSAFIYFKCLKNFTKAIEYFQRITRLESLNIDAYFNLGLSYYFNGDKEKAAETFQELIMFCPDDSSAQYNLALISNELGRKDQALILLERYLGMPKDITEYNYIKTAKRKLKEWKED